MTLHSLYKRLLLLALVFGPFFWLVFTNDGQRRVDLVLLSLLSDAKTMNVAFAKLQGSAREADLRGSFPELPFHCEDRVTELGDRLCVSPIAAFNGAPAHFAAAYFREGGLAALKLAYRADYHHYVAQELYLELGAAAPAGDGTVTRWPAPGGVVLLPTRPPQNAGETAVMWLSQRQLQDRLPRP